MKAKNKRVGSPMDRRPDGGTGGSTPPQPTPEERAQAKYLWNKFVNTHSDLLGDIMGYVTSECLDISIPGDLYCFLTWFIKFIRSEMDG